MAFKKWGCTILVMLLLLSLGGCNKQEQHSLSSLIAQSVQDETLYTTSSYNNYLSSLNRAKTVTNNPFSFKSAIVDAQKEWYSAIQNLEIATKGIYRIDYEFVMQENHSVGNEWLTSVTYNGQSLKSGDTIMGAFNETLVMNALVREEDSIPDIGKGAVLLNLRDESTDSVQITVRENRGRYSGNTAIWELRCRATLVERI